MSFGVNFRWSRGQLQNAGQIQAEIAEAKKARENRAKAKKLLRLVGQPQYQTTNLGGRRSASGVKRWATWLEIEIVLAQLFL